MANTDFENLCLEMYGVFYRNAIHQNSCIQALYIQYLDVRALQIRHTPAVCVSAGTVSPITPIKGQNRLSIGALVSIPGNTPPGTLARCPYEMEPKILFSIICTLRCWQYHSNGDSHISLDSGSLFRGRRA